MPYIKNAEKVKFEKGLKDLPPASSAGELNYLFTKIAHKYLKHHGLKYQYLNDVSGALTNANLELYRRMAAPYEDQKIKENGDV